MPDFSLALALLKKPIEDTYSKASEAIKKKLVTLRTTAKVKSLHKKLWQIQRVKTIWNTDRPLSLTSIYYPVSVQFTFPDKSQVRQVNSADDLQHGHVIVYGTAGQGKSILMKYLVGREIRSGKRIPLLCELRNLRGASLESYLIDQFSLLLGSPTDGDILAIFASNGNVSFLLDGFDEIDDDQVQSVLQQIDVLSIKYPKSKIVMTSRPNSDCRNLTNFNVVNIKPLGISDLIYFYKKITKDGDFADRLVKAIRASASQIQSLVTTPLLATLLAISYRAAHKIPIDFSDFYEELFQVLLVRHDASKLGWRRKRASGLNDRQIQQVFEAFCFAVRRKRLTFVDVSDARELVGESSKNCAIPVDGDLFLEDIKKITCLVIQEGKKIEFVHASVPQFFSSMYIKGRTEPQGDSFYSQLAAGQWRFWLGEISFLEQIDSHRFGKYFVIPDIRRFLGYIIDNDGLTNHSKLLSNFKVKKTVVEGANKEVRYYTANDTSFSAHCTLALEKRLFSLIFNDAFDGARGWRYGFDRDPDVQLRSYEDIAIDRGAPVVHAVKESIDRCVEICRSTLESRELSTANAEQLTDFISLS
jgi:hypothetical protein